MKLRWRLVLALVLAGLLPLIPLLFVVQSSVSLSADSLAPEEIGDALGSAVDFSRKLLAEKQKTIRQQVVACSKKIPLPGNEGDFTTELDSSQTLYVHVADDWFRLKGDGWVYGSPDITSDELSFRGYPTKLSAEVEKRGVLWRMEQTIAPDLIQRAQKMQAVRADWTLRTLDRDRLMLSLVLTYVFFYLGAVLISILAAIFVIVPETRRIEELAQVMVKVGEGEENLRAREGGGGEVAKLASTFNLMIERLDTSRRKAAEMEKMAAWRELARVLAHEIKNPLTPIQLSVQQITDEYHGNDERYEELLSTTREIVDEEIESLRKLVREFSDFARAPQLELAMESPEDLARDLDSFYGKRVNLTMDTVPPEMLFDREKLKRALINLLDNALHAAGDDGEVQLSLKQEGETLLWAVEDSGSGIEEERREEVFEPYVTSKRSGVGLGLPVVRSVAREHGGEVILDQSVMLGGARFRIYMPIRLTASSTTGDSTPQQ